MCAMLLKMAAALQRCAPEISDLPQQAVFCRLVYEPNVFQSAVQLASNVRQEQEAAANGIGSDGRPVITKVWQTCLRRIVMLRIVMLHAMGYMLKEKWISNLYCLLLSKVLQSQLRCMLNWSSRHANSRQGKDVFSTGTPFCGPHTQVEDFWLRQGKHVHSTDSPVVWARAPGGGLWAEAGAPVPLGARERGRGRPRAAPPLPVRPGGALHHHAPPAGAARLSSGKCGSISPETAGDCVPMSWSGSPHSCAIMKGRVVLVCPSMPMSSLRIQQQMFASACTESAVAVDCWYGRAWLTAGRSLMRHVLPPCAGDEDAARRRDERRGQRGRLEGARRAAVPE